MEKNRRDLLKALVTGSLSLAILPRSPTLREAPEMNDGVGYRWNQDHWCCDGWCRSHMTWECSNTRHIGRVCDRCRSRPYTDFLLNLKTRTR